MAEKMIRTPEELRREVNHKIEKIVDDLTEALQADVSKALEEGADEFLTKGEIQWKKFLWENISMPNEDKEILKESKYRARIKFQMWLKSFGWSWSCRTIPDGNKEQQILLLVECAK